jgi:predicted MPP superfamily phosphohydrolase
VQARAIVFTIVLLLVSGLAHGLLGMWLLDAFPTLRARKRVVYGVLASLVGMATLTRLMTIVTHSGFIGWIFALAMCELIIVLFSAIPVMLVRAAARGVEVVAPPPQKPEAADQGLSRRQVIERVGGVAALGATSSLVGWGAIIGRHDFIVEEVPVRIVGLPRVLDGYTIAQISDIHVGLLVRQGDLAEGLDKLASTPSDLVVITGDIVDFDPRYIPLAASALSKIRARDGVFAIYGNHDHYTGASAVGTALRAAGIDVLVNDGRLIRAKDGGGFALLGVDDLGSIRMGGPGPRLDRAMSAVPDDRPRILLSHQPATVDIWAGRVALQLSGHTHGGQFNPFGLRPADLVMHYVAGRYEVGGSATGGTAQTNVGKTSLWVNRGFGVVGPPARVGAPPEVTKIVLVAA